VAWGSGEEQYEVTPHGGRKGGGSGGVTVGKWGPAGDQDPAVMGKAGARREKGRDGCSTLIFTRK
jgi:hypothetical protein